MTSVYLVKEKILKIVETSFDGTNGEYDGYIITTDKQTIQLGIKNGQSCCEMFGCYLTTEDDIADYIDSELISIKESEEMFGNNDEYPNYESTNSMFINIETSNGLLQSVAYNNHNGYYAHGACVISQQLNIDTSL